MDNAQLATYVRALTELGGLGHASSSREAPTAETEPLSESEIIVPLITRQSPQPKEPNTDEAVEASYALSGNHRSASLEPPRQSRPRRKVQIRRRKRPSPSIAKQRSAESPVVENGDISPYSRSHDAVELPPRPFTLLLQEQQPDLSDHEVGNSPSSPHAWRYTPLPQATESSPGPYTQLLQGQLPDSNGYQPLNSVGSPHALQYQPLPSPQIDLSEEQQLKRLLRKVPWEKLLDIFSKDGPENLLHHTLVLSFADLENQRQVFETKPALLCCICYITAIFPNTKLADELRSQIMDLLLPAVTSVIKDAAKENPRHIQDTDLRSEELFQACAVILLYTEPAFKRQESLDETKGRWTELTEGLQKTMGRMNIGSSLTEFLNTREDDVERQFPKHSLDFKKVIYITWYTWFVVRAHRKLGLESPTWDGMVPGLSLLTPAGLSKVLQIRTTDQRLQYLLSELRLHCMLQDSLQDFTPAHVLGTGAIEVENWFSAWNDDKKALKCVGHHFFPSPSGHLAFRFHMSSIAYFSLLMKRPAIQHADIDLLRKILENIEIIIKFNKDHMSIYSTSHADHAVMICILLVFSIPQDLVNIFNIMDLLKDINHIVRNSIAVYNPGEALELQCRLVQFRQLASFPSLSQIPPRVPQWTFNPGEGTFDSRSRIVQNTQSELIDNIEPLGPWSRFADPNDMLLSPIRETDENDFDNLLVNESGSEGRLFSPHRIPTQSGHEDLLSDDPGSPLRTVALLATAAKVENVVLPRPEAEQALSTGEDLIDLA